MTIWEILKICVITLAIQLIPGWALLSLGGFKKQWSALQRWILAFFLGMATYPVIFYAARVLLPGFQIGLNKIYLFLGLCLIFTLWRNKNDWRDNFKFEKADLIVLGLIIVSLFTRLAPVLQYSYPGWTDSLHHTIITKLVMTSGKLPYNMLPFDPGDLSAYHLGLYSLTGSVGLLANTTPHHALLVYSQIINAMAGLAVFILLDKILGRLPAIAGMVFVSFISFQPALYFNWGRFPQLVAQTSLLPSALLFWYSLEEATKQNTQFKDPKRFNWVIPAILSALTISATALIHFRVAAFYLPLLILLFLFSILSKSKSANQRKRILFQTIAIAFMSLLFMVPALIPGLNTYLNPTTTAVENLNETYQTYANATLKDIPFYLFEYSEFFNIGLTKGISILVLLSLLFGLCFKKTRFIALIAIFWTFSLWLIGSLPALNIPKLAIVNMTGVMILAYLPGGLAFAVLLHGLEQLLDKPFKPSFVPILTWATLFIAIPFIVNRTDTIEPYRHFMSQEDERAMHWIKTNTPDDGIFAVNPMFWIVGAFHGSDAGYWIPYFAERDTSTRTMLSSYAEDFAMLVKRNDAVYQLYENPTEIDILCQLGLNYLYSGKKDPLTQKDFDIDQLLEQPNVELIYNQDGIEILKLCP